MSLLIYWRYLRTIISFCITCKEIFAGVNCLRIIVVYWLYLGITISFCVTCKEIFAGINCLRLACKICFVWLIIISHGWYICKYRCFSRRKLKIWFSLSLTLFGHSILHSLIENLKLLLDCHYLSFPFILWCLVTKLSSWFLSNSFLCIQGFELTCTSLSITRLP